MSLQTSAVDSTHQVVDLQLPTPSGPTSSPEGKCHFPNHLICRGLKPASFKEGNPTFKTISSLAEGWSTNLRWRAGHHQLQGIHWTSIEANRNVHLVCWITGVATDRTLCYFWNPNHPRNGSPSSIHSWCRVLDLLSNWIVSFIRRYA